MPRRPPGSQTGSVWHRPAPAPSRSTSAPAFSREEITGAAIELADTSGLEAVSMRRIAERIGSAPTTIYWYVSDKSELYELMVDRVIGEIELPDEPSGGWRAGLSTLAWVTLAAIRRHRWFSQIGIQPVPGPGTLRYAAATLAILAESGIDETTGIKVLATLNNYIFGFLQREVAWRQPLAPAEPPVTPAADRTDVREGQLGEAPMTDEGIASRMRLAGDESFAFGLDRFLDGIAVLVDSLPRPGDPGPPDHRQTDS